MKYLQLFENYNKMPSTVYHGSHRHDITEFIVDNSKFALLGSGIYTYKLKTSASMFGFYIYKINIKKLNIAPLDFKFSDEDIFEIFKLLNIKKDKIDISGLYSPLWWCMDGWDMFHLTRKECVDTIKAYMTINLKYDGIFEEYGNGGLVCCIWNYNKIKPVRA